MAGFECSGNSPRSIEGLVSNGSWTGVPLRAVLDRAGIADQALEFVFFGADRGTEDVEFRAQTFTVEQQFGRSISRDQIGSAEPFLAWALNGEPLTTHQGAPLRLIVPGWYGVGRRRPQGVGSPRIRAALLARMSSAAPAGRSSLRIPSAYAWTTSGR